MTCEEVKEYLKVHGNDLINQIKSREYRPQPVRRVEIPKPNGGVRKLGIPIVIDRIIEQALVQKLTPIFEPTFSEYSYGFRPNRRCQNAIDRALELDLTYRIKKINEVLRGWINYYRFSNMKKFLSDRIGPWLRNAIRVIIWKQWKVSNKQISSLIKLGIDEGQAKGLTYCRRGYQFISHSCIVQRAITKARLKKRGLIDPLEYYLKPVA